MTYSSNIISGGSFYIGESKGAPGTRPPLGPISFTVAKSKHECDFFFFPLVKLSPQAPKFTFIRKASSVRSNLVVSSGFFSFFALCRERAAQITRSEVLKKILKQLITYVETLRFLKLKQKTIYIAVTILLLLYFLSKIKIKFQKCTQKRMKHESGNDSCSLM